MLTQTSSEKPKHHALDWGGWSLQLGRNQDGTYGVWTFRGQPVLMVRSGKA